MKSAIICCIGAGLLTLSTTPANAGAAMNVTGPDRTEVPQPLSDTDLSSHRAGATIVAGNQTLNAITSGNVLNGDYTAGSITLSDSALSNFNGLGNFAINTGAQVSLQSALNLTINVGQ